MFSRLLLLFLLVPLAELTIFYLLGSRLGLIPTLAIILLTGVLGAALTKSQGLRVLNEFRQSTAAGKLPHAPIIEGLIILVAGALLLTPGFLTDTIGFLALVPAVRALLRQTLIHHLSKKIKIITPTIHREPKPPTRTRSEALDDGNVIDV